MNQFHLFEEEDYIDYSEPRNTINAPRGTPQKRESFARPEPRRSLDGISPMVITQRKPERLMSLGELKNQIVKYDAMPDKILAKLFTTGLMDRQAKLIHELTPDELAFWNSENQ